MNKSTRRPVSLLAAALGTAALLFVAVACTKGPTPSVNFLEPTEGATVSAGSVKLFIEATNFMIVNQLGKSNRGGEGHVHFFLDVDPIPTTKGKPAVSAEGTYHAVAASSYTIPGIAPGKHTLAVELVNNDHTPLDPPVVAAISITAK